MKAEYEQYLNELIEQVRGRIVESQRASLTRADLVRYQCSEFTRMFVRKFPHLRRVAGFYGNPEPNVEERTACEHWWCVDTDGTIVDPTVEQFFPGGTYTELQPDKHVIKVGRCMNCGDDIFGLKINGSKCVCSDDCERALEDYYG